MSKASEYAAAMDGARGKRAAPFMCNTFEADLTTTGKCEVALRPPSGSVMLEFLSPAEALALGRWLLDTFGDAT